MVSSSSFVIGKVAGLATIYKAMVDAQTKYAQQMMLSADQIKLITAASQLQADTLAKQYKWSGVNLNYIRDIVKMGNAMNAQLSSLNPPPPLQPQLIQTSIPPPPPPLQPQQNQDVGQITDMNWMQKLTAPPSTALSEREFQRQGMTKLVGAPNPEADRIWGKDKPPKAKDTKEMTNMFQTIKDSGFQAVILMAAVVAITSLLTAMFPFQQLFTTLTDIFTVYGSVISQSFMPVIEAMYATMLSPTVMAMVETLTAAFGEFFIALLPIGEALLPLGMMLMEALLMPIQSLIPLIEAFLPSIAMMVPSLGQLAIAVGSVLAGAINIIAPLLAMLMPILTPITAFLNLLIGILLQLAGLLLNSLGWALTKVMELLENWGIVDFFVKLLNGVIRAINWIVSGINGFIPGNDYDLSTLPFVTLANGGITTGPMLAMIGDNKSGREAVIPLDDNNNPLNSGTTINIYGDITQEKLYQAQRAQWLARI